MSKVNQRKIKDIAIITTAMLLPGGLIALGLWKVFELLIEENKNKKER